MALLVIEGFEGYNPADLPNSLQKTASYYNSSTVSLDGTVYRSGAYSLKFDAAESFGIAFPSGRSNTDPVYIGFGYRTAGVSLNRPLITIKTVNGPTFAVGLASTYLKALRGDYNSTVIGTGTIPLVADVWYYIEVKVIIKDSLSANDCQIKVNGTLDIDLPAATDNKNQTETSWVAMEFGSVSSVTHYIDDIYVCDGTGSLNNTFLGPCVVERLYPNGNGNESEWDGSDGNQVDNYALVDETAPSTSDYIEAQNVDESDLFTYSNLTTSINTIRGVSVKNFVAKTSTGVRTYTNLCRSNGTTYEGAAEHTCDESAVYKQTIFEADPDTDALWGESALNAAEFGITVST